MFHNGILKFRIPRKYIKAIYKMIEENDERFDNVSHVVRVSILRTLREEGYVTDDGELTFEREVKS